VRYQDGVCVCVTPVEQGGGGGDSTADINHWEAIVPATVGTT
jgi:hypothetical protein